MNISIVGTGKLGACMVGLYASKGHRVYGVDINKESIEKLNKGQSPVCEPHLQDFLATFRQNYQCSTSFDCIAETDMTFIIVPTPTDETGEFSNRFVDAALRAICPVLKSKEGYHVINITSTVKLGSMRHVFQPMVELLTGKMVGHLIGLNYNPEFIALGDVIHGLFAPDAILIGESDKHSGDVLQEFYRQTCQGNHSVHRMTWENAEVAKLMLNVAVTTKISLANVAAEVCDRIPFGNVDAVTRFLGRDSRIGDKYIRGGLSYSGTCFPRDNRAFVKMGKRLGLDLNMQKAVDEFNYHHNQFVYEKVASLLPHDAKRVALLGVSFKPNTPVTEESPAIYMSYALKGTHKDIEVTAYDPQASHPSCRMQPSVEAAVAGADLAVLLTPWDEFKHLRADHFKTMRHQILLDCWRLVGEAPFVGTMVKYYALGVNNNGQEPASNGHETTEVGVGASQRRGH